MANCIDRAVLMGQLTSAEMQQKLKQASGAEAYNEFLFLVNAAPAADAVPVVRCEDCKKFKTYKCHMNNACGYDDFCSYGERNEVT